MGFRFRKSFKIMPGVRVNLSKSGTSLSLGGKGFTHNISSRGSRTTISAPGTGLSYVINKKSKKTAGSKGHRSGAAIQGVDSGSSKNKLSGVCSFILIIFATIFIAGLFAHDDEYASSADAKSDISALDRGGSQRIDVYRTENRIGFLLYKTEARVAPSADAKILYMIRGGAEVTIKGATKDGSWLLVSEFDRDEEYYVPIGNVATFSP